VNRLVLFGIFLSVATATGTGWAQQRPDFSGSWKLDEARSNPLVVPPSAAAATPRGAPPPPSPPRPVALSITQTETDLRMARTMTQAAGTAVYETLYTFGPRESTNQMGLLILKSSVSWNGDSLVLSSTRSMQGNALGEVKEEFSLNDHALVVQETLTTRVGTLMGKWVYVKVD
jgi:hypothetical protein